VLGEDVAVPAVCRSSSRPAALAVAVVAAGVVEAAASADSEVEVAASAGSVAVEDLAVAAVAPAGNKYQND
jgi:hypothetical protein